MVLLLMAWLVVGVALTLVVRRLGRPMVPLEVSSGTHGTRTSHPSVEADASRRAALRVRGGGVGAALGILSGLLLGGLSLGLVLLACTVGLLIGLLAGEIVSDLGESPDRVASLSRRRIVDLVPLRWALVLVASAGVLTTVIAIGLRPHQTGVSSATCDGRTWSTDLTWPTTRGLVASAVAAIAVLILLGAVLRRAANRVQSSADLTVVAWDNGLRAMTARQALALASSALLFLAAGISISLVGGYTGPCEPGPVRLAEVVAGTSFLVAIGLLFVAGADPKRAD